jgi:hypothetical protein
MNAVIQIFKDQEGFSTPALEAPIIARADGWIEAEDK